MKNDFIMISAEMLEEFGVTVECIVYGMVGRYTANGNGLYMSKESLARYLHCSKSAVCVALSHLLKTEDENGEPKEPYIEAIHRNRNGTRSNDTTIYRLNPKNPLSTIWGSPKNGQGSPENGQGVVQKMDKGCPENGQGSPENGQGVVQKMDKGCPENGQPTITKEFTRDTTREGERENAHAPTDGTETEFSSAQNQPTQNKTEFHISQEQIDHILYGYDYSHAKHQPYTYIQKAKKYPYATVCTFITDDGGIMLDKQQEDEKRKAAILAPPTSSFDISDFEKLVNQF